jgi:hypothetical protein
MEAARILNVGLIYKRLHDTSSQRREIKEKRYKSISEFFTCQKTAIFVLATVRT